MTNVFDKSQLDVRSNPNLLINGDFSVNQRFGTDSTGIGNTAYLADRWFASSTTGITHTTIKGGSLNYPLGIDSFSWFTGTSADRFYYEQRIEMNANFMGGDLTLSFWMYTNDSGSSGEVMSAWLRTRYDSDGTQADYTFTSGDGPIETIGSWAKYQFHGSIPDRDTTKTQHVNDYVSVILNFPRKLDSSSGVGIAQAKLERGSVATPFIADDPATNLTKCHRYYFKTNWTMLPGQQWSNTTGYAQLNIPPHMRQTTHNGNVTFGDCEWLANQASTAVNPSVDVGSNLSPRVVVNISAPANTAAWLQAIYSVNHEL